MRKFFSICLVFVLASCGNNDDKGFTPPKAAKVLHETKLSNGAILQDYYHWMRDKAWPKGVHDKKILAHLKAENDYVDTYFKDQKDNKTKLYEEMKARIKLADISAPIKRDDYYYYTRTEADSSYPIYCRKQGSLEAPEEIILDVNELAKGQKYTIVGSIAVSEDHNLLAYSVDFTGQEKYKLRILDLRNYQYLPDEIDNVTATIIWHREKEGFFYVPKNEKLRTDCVKFHALGSDVPNDKVVYKEKDDMFGVSIGRTSSREYLIVYSGTASENELQIVPLKGDDFSPQLVKARQNGVIYSIQHNADYIYALTNEFGSNMSIIRSNLQQMEDNIWRTYIPLDEEKYLEDFDMTEDHMMLNYKASGLPLIKILHVKDAIAKIVKFPDASYVANAYTTNFDEDDIRVNYSSLNRSGITYSYDFDHARLVILKEREVLGSYNSEDYEVKRIWAKNDAVEIPISLIYKKDKFKEDGSNPVYLYGYGSYGLAVPPSFYTQYVSLLDRGFIFAIAHIRGGDDLGYGWYEDAKLLKKKNSFNDFIACAEYLIDQKYTSKGKIAISGGSAGGMLVGASMNMRPDLFQAVVASSPSVDVLNKMLNKNLMGTPYHYKELGNPEEKEYLDYIKSYSPYENVKKAEYPAIWASVGVSDPRVPYDGAAKWIAKIRAHNQSKNPAFLKVNMGSGHFGSSDRFEWLKEYAEQFIFVLDVFDIKPF